MPRTRHTPINYWKGGGRPDEPEAEAVVAPTLSLDGIEAGGPERPVGFGRKCVWLAIRVQEPGRVLDALGVRSSKPCGWERGIATAYEERQVIFVTPPVGGWTLVAAPNVTFYDDGDNLQGAHVAFVERLAEGLGEVQCFSSHDGVAHGSWTRAVSGKVTRSYRYSEEPCWSIGEPEEAERALETQPAEEAAFAVAARWSIDPLTLGDADLPPSLGTLGVLPGVLASPCVPSPYQRRYNEDIVPPSSEPLACNLYWDYRRLEYVCESLVETGDGRRHVGPKKATVVREHADVPRIATALRTALNRFARTPTPLAHKGVPRRKDCVLVEVEYAGGRVAFHPTRCRFGRVRRVAKAATHCEWNARAGLLAHALDEAIVRTMAARSFLVRLAEAGGAT